MYLLYIFRVNIINLNSYLPYCTYFFRLAFSLQRHILCVLWKELHLHKVQNHICSLKTKHLKAFARWAQLLPTTTSRCSAHLFHLSPRRRTLLRQMERGKKAARLLWQQHTAEARCSIPSSPRVNLIQQPYARTATRSVKCIPFPSSILRSEKFLS